MLLGLPKVSPLIVLMFFCGPTLGSEVSEKATQTASAGPGETSSPSTPTAANGFVMLDYETIPIPGYSSIDLLGFHAYKKFNSWLSLGVGGHAPLIGGDYGGFMVFDASVHAQHRLFWNLFGDVGASLGGGGGGKSVEQSKIISGTGGFQKTYFGVGYDFDLFSAGVNLSKVRLAGSAIHNSQFDLYIQMPFSYEVGSYANAGTSLPSKWNLGGAEISAQPTDENLEIGLDNIIQIKPDGSYKGKVNLIDVQFDHYLTDRSYLLFEGGIGYRGLVLYNQVFGGIGYKYAYSPRINIRGQLSVGSGGYDPDKINTGPGLLLYPKLSAEYLLSDTLGVSLMGGYLYAPKGTSKNLTLGASLNFHNSAETWSHSDTDTPTNAQYKGYRFSLFEQSELHTNVGEKSPGTLKLLTGQFDNIINTNLYAPVQCSIAYNAYDGNPGYGEIMAGVGVQSAYSPHDRFQTFAQLLVGTNATSLLAKPGVGMNYSLTDQLAIFGQIGATFSLANRTQRSNQDIRSPSIGLGLSYRFSRPHG